jgi:predicted nucleic acid-binding protein
MIVDCFLDTNVLFYAAMARFTAPAKYERARWIIAETDFGLSGQVLQEFFVNVTRKTDKPLSSQVALQWISAFIDRPCAVIDPDLVIAAVEVSDRYHISYWDGAILAAAQRLSAPVIYTEDLNHDQVYGSVRAINPFRVH